MRSIGMREICRHAGRYLRGARRGEPIESADRCGPVGRLVPPPSGAAVDRLITDGRLTPPRRAPPDLAALEPALGVPLPSQALLGDRTDRR